MSSNPKADDNSTDAAGASAPGSSTHGDIEDLQEFVKFLNKITESDRGRRTRRALSEAMEPAQDKTEETSEYPVRESPSNFTDELADAMADPGSEDRAPGGLDEENDTPSGEFQTWSVEDIPSSNKDSGGEEERVDEQFDSVILPDGADIPDIEHEDRVRESLKSVFVTTYSELNIDGTCVKDLTMVSESDESRSSEMKAGLENDSMESSLITFSMDSLRGSDVERENLSDTSHKNHTYLTIQIPFYAPISRSCNDVQLGYIDIEKHQLPSSDTYNVIDVVGMVSTYFLRGLENNGFRINLLHNVPRSAEYRAQDDEKRTQVSCRECKESDRDVYRKIPGQCLENGAELKVRAVNNEHSLFLLFRLAHRIYPLCLEFEYPCPVMKLSINGIDYALNENVPSTVAAESPEVLSITAAYHDEVKAINILQFNPDGRIFLSLGEDLFNITLTNFNLEALDPSATADSIDGDPYFKALRSSHNRYFKLKGGNELCVDTTGPVFLNDRWSYGDSMNAKGTTQPSTGKNFREMILKVGESGTVAVHSNGLHKLLNVCKPFVTTDNRAVVLEKYLKVKLKFNGGTLTQEMK